MDGPGFCLQLETFLVGFSMLRFSANLSFLFLDRPFLERFEAAAACGFKGVEFHFPYAFPADEVRDAARRAGVEVVLFNFPPGDWAAGERGIACLPDRVGEFRDGVALAARYAEALDCPRLNCLAGLRPADSETALLTTLVDNLRHAADALARPAARCSPSPSTAATRRASTSTARRRPWR
jgi:hydroxypyruvate isomerase